MITSEDISEVLYGYLMKLEKAALLNVMFEAMDEMQAYNGRSLQECVHLALGSEKKDKKYYFPKIEEINKRFS